MTDDEQMFTWLEEIATIYREVVAEAGDEGIQRRDAYKIALERILLLVERGDLTIPLDDTILAALARVDESDGKRADAVLKHAVDGQEMLSLDGDPLLDVVVTLGAGMRKPWRHVTRSDLMLMDQLRYKNVRDVQDAYNQWREIYEPALLVLDRYGTFGEAVESGGFTPEPAA